MSAPLPYIARALAQPLHSGYCPQCGDESAPQSCPPDERGECIPCDIDWTYYLVNGASRGGNFWDAIPDDEIPETRRYLNQHLAMLRKLRDGHREQGTYP